MKPTKGAVAPSLAILLEGRHAAHNAPVDGLGVSAPGSRRLRMPMTSILHEKYGSSFLQDLLHAPNGSHSQILKLCLEVRTVSCVITRLHNVQQ